LAVLYSVSEIGLHTELSYVGCVLQCKLNWLTRKVTFFTLCCAM